MTSPKSISARPAIGFQPFASASRAVAAAFKAAWTAMRNRRAVNELHDLDDYLLSDIGLTRSDLRLAVQDPMVLDPSIELAAIARANTRPAGARLYARRT